MKKLVSLLFIALFSLPVKAQPLPVSCYDFTNFLLVGFKNHLDSPDLTPEFLEKSAKKYLEFLDSEKENLSSFEYKRLIKKIEAPEFFKKQTQKLICDLFDDIDSTVKRGEKRKLEWIKKYALWPAKDYEIDFLTKHISERELELRIRKKSQAYLFHNKEALKQARHHLLVFPSVFEVDKRVLLLKAFLRTLDPFSDFLPEEEIRDFKSTVTSKMTGLGVSYNPTPAGFYVNRIMPGSPLEEAQKIESGDTILEMNDSTVNIDNYKETHSRTWNNGETVSFKVLKKDKSIVTFKIQVGTFSVLSVQSKLQNIQGKNILVLTVPSFYRNEDENTGVSDDLLVEYKKHSGTKIDLILLDFRSNTGGYLEEAIKMAGLFLGEKTVLYDRTHVSIDPLKSELKQEIKEPVVILQNTNSASATEIVAGALKDYKRALVVGDPNSFGKGLIQVLIRPPVINPSLIKITRSQYYFPSGNSIQNTGVVADVPVPGILSGNKTELYYGGKPSIEVEFEPVGSIDLTEIKSNSKERLKDKPHLLEDEVVMDESLKISLDYLKSLEKNASHRPK